MEENAEECLISMVEMALIKGLDLIFLENDNIEIVNDNLMNVPSQ